MHGVVLGFDGGSRRHARVPHASWRLRRRPALLVGDADAFRTQRGGDRRDPAALTMAAMTASASGIEATAHAPPIPGTISTGYDERAQPFHVLRAADGDERRAIALDLFREKLHVRTGREPDDSQLIRETRRRPRVCFCRWNRCCRGWRCFACQPCTTFSERNPCTINVQ